VFVAQLAELQFAIVAISVVARSHLAELARVPPQGKHFAEAHKLALRMTARDLAAAVDTLNEKFAATRADSRETARLIARAENLAANT